MELLKRDFSEDFNDTQGRHVYFFLAKAPSPYLLPDGAMYVQSYRHKRHIESIDRDVLGFVFYDYELTAQQLDTFKLCDSDGYGWQRPRIDEHEEAEE